MGLLTRSKCGFPWEEDLEEAATEKMKARMKEVQKELVEGERMLQGWLVGGNAGLRSWRVDRPGLTLGCASLIPVHFKSKHSFLYSTSSIHKHFPTREGGSHNERPFCQRFCARYADCKWKGLRGRKNLLLHPLFKLFILLFNQSEPQYVYVRMCVCAHALLAFFSCLLAQVHAAALTTALMVPDQEVGRNERGPDERKAEEPGKVNVWLAPYGVTEVPMAGSPS